MFDVHGNECVLEGCVSRRARSWPADDAAQMIWEAARARSERESVDVLEAELRTESAEAQLRTALEQDHAAKRALFDTAWQTARAGARRRGVRGTLARSLAFVLVGGAAFHLQPSAWAAGVVVTGAWLAVRRPRRRQLARFTETAYQSRVLSEVDVHPSVPRRSLRDLLLAAAAAVPVLISAAALLCGDQTQAIAGVVGALLCLPRVFAEEPFGSKAADWVAAGDAFSVATATLARGARGSDVTSTHLRAPRTNAVEAATAERRTAHEHLRRLRGRVSKEPAATHKHALLTKKTTGDQAFAEEADRRAGLVKQAQNEIDRSRRVQGLLSLDMFLSDNLPGVSRTDLSVGRWAEEPWWVTLDGLTGSLDTRLAQFTADTFTYAGSDLATGQHPAARLDDAEGNSLIVVAERGVAPRLLVTCPACDQLVLAPGAMSFDSELAAAAVDALAHHHCS